VSKGKDSIRPWSSYGALGVAALVLVLLSRRRQQRGAGYSEVAIETASEAGASSALKSTFWRFTANLAVQDWMVVTYLLFLMVAVLHGDGPRRAAAIQWVLVDVVALITVLVLVRGGLVKVGFTVGFLYRLALLGAPLGSFLQLQYILPTATHYALDAKIYALDQAVFGLEPAEAWDHFVTPATTEWFSFFYYGYFFILAVHVLPFLFLGRDMRVFSEFAFGVLFLFCVGQALYLAVPGYGPYLFLAPHFQHQLDGPFWWHLVKETVDSVEGSARKDIFPSLHTAAPTFLALFSFRHRRAVAAFRFTWPPLAFFASQIIVATMFLRWHYLIDICAGLLLAAGALLSARGIATWESARRPALGLPPVWTELAWPHTVGRRRGPEPEPTRRLG
jgi:hypothetical protein